MSRAVLLVVLAVLNSGCSTYSIEPESACQFAIEGTPVAASIREACLDVDAATQAEPLYIFHNGLAPREGVLVGFFAESELRSVMGDGAVAVSVSGNAALVLVSPEPIDAVTLRIVMESGAFDCFIQVAPVDFDSSCDRIEA